MVLGSTTIRRFCSFIYVTITLFGHRSHDVQLKQLLNALLSPRACYIPLPLYCNEWYLTQYKFSAVPVSLTTTQGITFVFSSWRYLDVSVHAVRLFILYIQMKIPKLHSGGFPHSDTSGSKLFWQLPEAFRSLTRPSSPLDAKASTKCPFKLSTNSHTRLLSNPINLHQIIKNFKDHNF